MIMDENKENQSDDGLNKTSPKDLPSKPQQQGDRKNKNKRIDYSDLDIEESTGGSAMEDQEDGTIRDMDDEEI